ncbi:hypothetical protein llap_8090 [Limosa lapponica baueri]|uniref:Uncharacterized protein n=1 Tax=Limosa lapponica baueri TaxID=1758121 RepID=A0A2I0U6F8_LIMLA|nr:hypothetical protein llap_8090 [Limosa lapponica baueri]
METTRGNTYELHQERFHLNVRKYLFPVRSFAPENNLPADVVESVSLEVFKIPSIQPVQIPLQGLSTLQQVNTPTQLGVICKFTEGALDPLIQITDKDVKENRPQYRTLWDTTRDRSPTGFNSIHRHSLGPTLQPVFNPVESIPIQAMDSV